MKSSNAFAILAHGFVLPGLRSLAPAEMDVEARDECEAASCEEELAARALLTLPDRALILTCLAGEVWMTCNRDCRDFIIRAGQTFELRSGDQAVLQALRPSRVRWTAVAGHMGAGQVAAAVQPMHGKPEEFSDLETTRAARPCITQHACVGEEGAMPLNVQQQDRPARGGVAACPFCASPRTATIEIDRDTWAVLCRSCMALGPHSPDERTAALKWNARGAAFG